MPAQKPPQLSSYGCYGGMHSHAHTRAQHTQHTQMSAHTHTHTQTEIHTQHTHEHTQGEIHNTHKRAHTHTHAHRHTHTNIHAHARTQMSTPKNKQIHTCTPTGGMPMTVTDSSILVKHLVGLLLQNPHKYAQLAKEHLVSMDMETGVGDADDVLAGAGAGKEATGPSQRQCSLQQQQPRQARTHRRAQHLNPSKTQQQQQPRQQADSAAQVQGSQALQPSAHAQPLLGFHKACSSVAKALMEALGPPRHSQLDGLFLQPSAHASPQQGPGAAAGHEVRKPGGPQQAAAGLEEALPDEAHTRMHRLIALLSRDSRRSARGWSRLKCEVCTWSSGHTFCEVGLLTWTRQPLQGACSP